MTLKKSSRGLGLSVSGGGTAGPVRVKRLFPQQPAALSNKLQAGDILLAANDVPLTGLTNYVSLIIILSLQIYVLRTSVRKEFKYLFYIAPFGFNFSKVSSECLSQSFQVPRKNKRRRRISTSSENPKHFVLPVKPITYNFIQ